MKRAHIIWRPILPLLTAVFLLSAVVDARAQRFPSELWHEGKIVLTSGDTLRGLVKYDLQQDLVQYVQGNQTADVFTARKVLFFEIFEEAIHKYRRFFALPYATSTGYKSTVFFELLEEGKWTLLAREALEYKTYGSSVYAWGAVSRLVLTYKYFFLKEDGTIEEFTGTKADLLDRMGRNSDAVEKYIKENRLKFDDKQDLTRIIEYYNSL